MSKFIIPKKIVLSKNLIKIKKELKNKRKSSELVSLSLEDKKNIEKIKSLTSILNLNNVTRTKAYFDFYNRHPEVHWSFLAHMVSRNAGWNMTDLKGGILSRLMTKKNAVAFFEFLELGNWLIFKDAFPQLLVYEDSLKKGKNQFYLLKHLNVSVFMETIWNHFWEECDSFILTVAQIINEQNYLELGILENEEFKTAIFDTLEFKVQDVLSMNQILFPFLSNGSVKLIGYTIHHFESLPKRILVGKLLYSILFRNQHQLKMIEKWAIATPHSGSRKDYWPHIFNDVDEGVPGSLLKPKLKSCQLLPGSTRIYSPKLEFAWKNQAHDPQEIADWYTDWKVIHYFSQLEENIDENIENKYCKTLEKLELAAYMKKTISSLY